ncbi:MAG: hypothetical protein C5B49_14375 [Bdellovibrio sp.]|nr:MAG: hypothetical protein C5B49_14375 [Bdellovibrio sp.]
MGGEKRESVVNFIWDNIFRQTDKERTLTQRLRQNVLFQDLTGTELRLLENIVNVRSYRPSETIFRQGEAGVGMYIISKGAVNIYVEEMINATGELQSVPVTHLSEGDFFGDLALVEENSRRSATAISAEETVLIGFFKPALLEIAQRNPTAGVKILLRLGEVLGRRLRETTAKITELKRETKTT